MVTQNTLHACEGIEAFQKIESATAAADLNKNFKMLKLQIELYTSTLHPDLPSDISIMILTVFQKKRIVDETISIRKGILFFM